MQKILLHLPVLGLKHFGWGPKLFLVLGNLLMPDYSLLSQLLMLMSLSLRVLFLLIYSFSAIHLNLFHLRFKVIYLLFEDLRELNGFGFPEIYTFLVLLFVCNVFSTQIVVSDATNDLFNISLLEGIKRQSLIDQFLNERLENKLDLLDNLQLCPAESLFAHSLFDAIDS